MAESCVVGLSRLRAMADERVKRAEFYERKAAKAETGVTNRLHALTPVRHCHPVHSAPVKSRNGDFVSGMGGELSDIRRKPSSFEEYWLASKAWQRKGLPLGTARALANAGFLKVEDLHSAHDLELATVPRVGPKSLVILYGLMGREMPCATKGQMNVSGRGRRRMSSLSVMPKV